MARIWFGELIPLSHQPALVRRPLCAPGLRHFCQIAVKIAEKCQFHETK